MDVVIAYGRWELSGTQRPSEEAADEVLLEFQATRGHGDGPVTRVTIVLAPGASGTYQIETVTVSGRKEWSLSGVTLFRGDRAGLARFPRGRTNFGALQQVEGVEAQLMHRLFALLDGDLDEDARAQRYARRLMEQRPTAPRQRRAPGIRHAPVPPLPSDRPPHDGSLGQARCPSVLECQR